MTIENNLTYSISEEMKFYFCKILLNHQYAVSYTGVSSSKVIDLIKHVVKFETINGAQTKVLIQHSTYVSCLESTRSPKLKDLSEERLVDIAVYLSSWLKILFLLKNCLSPK